MSQLNNIKFFKVLGFFFFYMFKVSFTILFCLFVCCFTSSWDNFAHMETWDVGSLVPVKSFKMFAYGRHLRPFSKDESLSRIFIVPCHRRYIIEILPIRRKTLYNQSINQSIVLCLLWHGAKFFLVSYKGQPHANFYILLTANNG